ncbi:MAG TPA: hypothetical protein VF212_11535 [Longimicrobiales bacterium]
MNRDRRHRRAKRAGVVRRSDIEPYTALRWVASLFKAAAVFLVVAVVAEFIAGLRLDGWAALPILLGEVARTAVLAVVLWGGGDMVRLLVDIGHDIRADRILLSRLLHRVAPVVEAGESRPKGRVRIEREPRPRPRPEAGPEAAD